MIQNTMAIALQGLQRNQTSLELHAHRIAQAGTPAAAPASGPVNLGEEMLGVLVARRGFEANLPVIQAADEMLGSLIDVLA